MNKGCWRSRLFLTALVLAVGWRFCIADEPAVNAPAEPLTRGQVDALARKFNPIARVEFTDADIKNVCKIVADSTGLSIVVSPQVTGRIGIWARDMNPIDLLDRAVRAAGAGLPSSPGSQSTRKRV